MWNHPGRMALVVQSAALLRDFHSIDVLVCSSQFQDLVQFTALDFSSKWPAVTVSDNSKIAEGLNGDTWNYGSNFGGISSTWTSGALTAHSYTDATGGMFGSFGVEDDNYGPTLCTSAPCRG